MNELTHPGGLDITKKAFDICGLPESAKVLDVGCGCGNTAGYLQDQCGFCVTGIDKSAEAISQAKKKHPGLELMEGDWQLLNFDPRSFDCVLMECTLSLMPNPIEAIHEAFRVLREGGYLVVHDLYLPEPSKEERRSMCASNGALVLEDIDAALNELGFETILFEDRKADLNSFAASLIFNGGSLDDCYRSEAKQCKTKMSYYLQIARKVKK